MSNPNEQAVPAKTNQPAPVAQPETAQAESVTRMEGFKEVLLKAVKEFDCDIYSQPVFQGNEDGTFVVTVTTQILDKRKLAQKSPLSKEVFDK